MAVITARSCSAATARPSSTRQGRATAGTWRSLYDDKFLAAASQVDDQIVPLADAWRSGGLA
ncbi:hypothetical protein ACFWNG_04940 [Streptomyces sp. NPDC058391]|uniref:hypothetical protein n=1 Tax=Streptomyces sp. NPDC058391 TaxID=3346476 RepID=UPI00365BE451